MQILDIFESSIETQEMPLGYYNAEDDNTVLKKDDTRKTKLTLAQLNKLRVMNDVRKLEHEKSLEGIQQQFKAPPADGEGAPTL